MVFRTRGSSRGLVGRSAKQRLPPPLSSGGGARSVSSICVAAYVCVCVYASGGKPSGGETRRLLSRPVDGGYGYGVGVVIGEVEESSAAGDRTAFLPVSNPFVRLCLCH